mgnify:CR=1 FL=1
MLDWRLISIGNRIPSELYTDQPYIVVADDGTWVCELTTAEGHEGAAGTHILITRSKNMGKTWCEPYPIEPERQPESAYGVLLKTSYGRIYCFYNYNKDDLRFLYTDSGEKSNRVDMQGYYVYRYSDDHGVTWSERYEIPIRETDIDRNNTYSGKLRIFWNVGRPWFTGRDCFIPIHKIRNMATESDPISLDNNKIHVAIVIDGGPKTISVIANGQYQDGMNQRQYGWGFYNPYMLHAKGMEGAVVPSDVYLLRIYGNALRTSEILGNYRHGTRGQVPCGTRGQVPCPTI